MRIADAQLFRYRLPLREPLSVGSHTLTERCGLLLRVQGAGGAEGWGEAAPLPGFSRESLADAVARAHRLATELPGTDLPDSGLDALLRGLPGAELPPSVRLAAESAVVELRAAPRGTTVLDVLGGGADTVALNALITDDGSDVEAEAARVRAAGYRAVKLKVGRRSVEADAARVRAVHELLGAEAALRLDANRAWTPEEARAFADSVDDLPLDYVEEPLRDPAALPGLGAATGLPVALDETTREEAPGTLPDALRVRAVVLKPTLLGGLTAARRWGQWARERGAVPVVSASYESGVGLRMLAALAATLSDAPAGLSTYTRLADDVLTPRLPLDGATVSVPDLYASSVDRSALTPVVPTD